jgi:hypothetical protein
MHLPEPRGPLSEAVCGDLVDRSSLSAASVTAGERLGASTADPLTDEDLQLTLAVCYELHYRGFDGVDDGWEWEPSLLQLRAGLEQRHLAALRQLIGPVEVTDEPIDRRLAALIAADDGPSLSAYMAKRGTLEQWREYLTVRSVYQPSPGSAAARSRPWSRSRPTSTAAAPPPGCTASSSPG